MCFNNKTKIEYFLLLFRFSTFKAFLGWSNYENNAKGYCPVSKARFIHPQFKDFGQAFCLLRLEKPVRLSSDVQVANLAGLPGRLPDNLVVAAWGSKATDPNHRPTEDLLGAAAPVYESCWKEYESKYLTDGVFCIGRKQLKYKTIHGDEGGPIYSPFNLKVYAMVVNYIESREIDLMHKPTLANNVALAQEWILKTIDNHKINTTEECKTY